MIYLLALALAFQGTQPPEIQLDFGQQTEAVTVPGFSLKCDLRKDDGSDTAVVLQFGDSQATRDLLTGALYGGSPKVTVVDDPKSSFASYELDAYGRDSVSGYARQGAGSGTLPFGERFQILIKDAAQDWQLDKPGRVAMWIQEHRAPVWGMHPFVRAIGFCDAIPASHKKVEK